MFINKPAKNGTFLPWHQDHWKYLDRPALITIWTALDPATIANGCVQVIPGTSYSVTERSRPKAPRRNRSPDVCLSGSAYLGETMTTPVNELCPRFAQSAPAREKAGFFKENGYLVVEQALTPEEIANLNRDAARICRGEYGVIPGLQPAVEGESDLDVLKRHLCIHFPHKMSATMFGAICHPSIVEVLTAVIGPNVKCMQSMLFIKAAGKPGQAWHQDEYYIPTRDRSLLGGWIALDDATTENGCLWVIPGSHKHGIIWPQHEHGDRRFDCGGEAMDFPYSDDDAVPVEVKAGSLVFFQGYLLHRSLPNYANSGFRRALVNHYMSAESFLPWVSTEAGEAVATADFRDVVMVAGKDPYAYKGTEPVSLPHVRPTGEGGCGKTGRNKPGIADNS
jgi:phytanoyl-CoA hydroxylase